MQDSHFPPIEPPEDAQKDVNMAKAYPQLSAAQNIRKESTAAMDEPN